MANVVHKSAVHANSQSVEFDTILRPRRQSIRTNQDTLYILIFYQKEKKVCVFCPDFLDLPQRRCRSWPRLDPTPFSRSYCEDRSCWTSSLLLFFMRRNHKCDESNLSEKVWVGAYVRRYGGRSVSGHIAF